MWMLASTYTSIFKPQQNQTGITEFKTDSLPETYIQISHIFGFRSPKMSQLNKYATLGNFPLFKVVNSQVSIQR